MSKYKVGDIIEIFDWGCSYSFPLPCEEKYSKYDPNFIDKQFDENRFKKVKGKIVEIIEKTNIIYLIDIGGNLVLMDDEGIMPIKSLTQSQKLNLFKKEK